MLTPRSLALVLPLLTACPGTTSAPDLPARTAAERLLPAAVDFLIGIDLAGVLASETYLQLEPKLRAQPTLLRWLTVLHGCEVDPLLARASLLTGTNGHEVVVVLTGPDLGDAEKLHCIADELAAQDRGRVPFSVHERDFTGVVADHDVVATIADPDTVVFATRGWSAPVHALIHGETTPDSPQRSRFARADRSAQVWYAGRLPRQFQLTEEPPTAQTIVGRLDIDAGLRADLLLGFADPGHVQQVRDELRDLEAHARNLGIWIGYDNQTDVIDLTMNGDELRVELALSSRSAAEFAEFLANKALMPPRDPRRFLALGGQHAFANYPQLLAYRRSGEPRVGLFDGPESPCALAWSDPEDMFEQTVTADELVLTARREGVAEVRCADEDLPLVVLAPTTMTIDREDGPGLLQVEAQDQFSLGVDLHDHDGWRVEVGRHTDIEWFIKGVMRPSHDDSAAILGLNPYIEGRTTFKAAAAGEGAIRARFGDLQTETIVVAVDAP